MSESDDRQCPTADEFRDRPEPDLAVTSPSTAVGGASGTATITAAASATVVVAPTPDAPGTPADPGTPGSPTPAAPGTPSTPGAPTTPTAESPNIPRTGAETIGVSTIAALVLAAGWMLVAAARFRRRGTGSADIEEAGARSHAT